VVASRHRERQVTTVELPDRVFQECGSSLAASSKSLRFNILPVSDLNPIFCGEFLDPGHCFQYFAGEEGGGVVVVEVEVPEGLKRLCRNLYRPCGTRFHFPLHPALKRWAKLFRPCGAGFCPLYSAAGHRAEVATQSLKPSRTWPLSAQLCPDTKRLIARRKGPLGKLELQIPPLRSARVGVTRKKGSGTRAKGVAVVEAEVPQVLKPDWSGRVSAQLKLCPDTQPLSAGRKGSRKGTDQQIPRGLKRLLKKSLQREETADSSGLKPLGMTRTKGFITAHLKVRPLKAAYHRLFQQPVRPTRDDKSKGGLGRGPEGPLYQSGC
jgi:hypothetical protein